jgi:hypothetical protein
MSIVKADVPIVTNPSVAEFAEIVRRGRPVVVRGATDEWPALQRWSLDYLRTVAGHRVVPIEFYPEGSYYGSWTTVKMTLRRYLEVVESTGAAELCYLAQAKVDDYLPELVDDLPVPAIVSALAEPGTGIFVGRDSVTSMHYHSRDEALLCQISGEKRVRLYAPADFDNLYYARPTSYRYNFSRIDFSDEPERRYPRLRRATPYEVTVVAGDALFIPLYWSHITQNQGLSISATMFWRSVDNVWDPLPLALRARFGFWFRSQVGARVMAGVEKALGYS